MSNSTKYDDSVYLSAPFRVDYYEIDNPNRNHIF